ncbi:MAG: TIGR00341 family protein [Paramuribaculum sp.]|nr:TIGR00341 family protein [Barnesiella sp.]MDE5821347.1 TIGR00341 family protein [Paramuribaculum sp.]
MMSNFTNRLSNFFINYFTLTPDLVPQAEAEQSIREGVSFRGTNILILIVAILIASLGLNTNSTAVIIGAMLISPLMGPIIGLGLGVGVHDYELIKRCLRNLVMAAGFSMLASTLYFLISPVNEGHSELLARTSPTIYDVLIGFFGGAAGIIGLGSKNKGNVIPGVAIATALMPPLCTAGYGIATWQLNYFFGASYLFLINSIYIAFATFIGVKLFKYKASADEDTARSRRVRKIVYTVAILTMLPSIWLTYRMLQDNKFSVNATNFVNQECEFPNTQVLSKEAYIDNGQRYIRIALMGKVLPADSLNEALSSRLGFYHLAGTKLIIVQGDAVNTGSAMTSSASDIYQLAQSTITRQQTCIDSLNTAIRQIEDARGVALKISPEIKVLFPQVEDIALASPVFSTVEDNRQDTVNVALVAFSSRMNTAQTEKFRKYLQARLGIPSISIVEVNPSVITNTKTR